MQKFFNKRVKVFKTTHFHKLICTHFSLSPGRSGLKLETLYVESFFKVIMIYEALVKLKDKVFKRYFSGFPSSHYMFSACR